MTAGDLAAICSAMANAAARRSAAGTTECTEPKWCSSRAVAVADV